MPIFCVFLALFCEGGEDLVPWSSCTSSPRSHAEHRVAKLPCSCLRHAPPCASFGAGVLQTSANLRNPGQNEIWGWQTMGGKRRVRRIEDASCEAKRQLTCPHRLPGSPFGGLLFVSAAGLTRGGRVRSFTWIGGAMALGCWYCLCTLCG